MMPGHLDDLIPVPTAHVLRDAGPFKRVMPHGMVPGQRRKSRGNTRVASIATPKGGPGKTTLTASLAVVAQEDAWTVVVLDTDTLQRTLTHWGRVRLGRLPAPKPLNIMSVADGTLDETIDRLARTEACDLILIDSPGSKGPIFDAAMMASDFSLIVTRPTMLDIPEAKYAVRYAREVGIDHAVVFNQVICLSSRVTDARALFEKAGVTTGPTVRSLVDYQDAMGAGLGVTEWDPSNSAAAEIRDLWAWMSLRLTHPQEITND